MFAIPTFASRNATERAMQPKSTAQTTPMTAPGGVNDGLTRAL